MKVIANVVNKEISGLAIESNTDLEFHKSTINVLNAIANNTMLIDDHHPEEAPIVNSFNHYVIVGEAPFYQVCAIHDSLHTSVNALRLIEGYLHLDVDSIGGVYKADELPQALKDKEVLAVVTVTK